MSISKGGAGEWCGDSVNISSNVVKEWPELSQQALLVIIYSGITGKKT